MSLLSVRRRPAVHLPPSRALSRQWHYEPPEPGTVPPARRIPIPGSSPVAYQLEDRRDCTQCGGLHNVLVRADGYECQHCKTVTYT